MRKSFIPIRFYIVAIVFLTTYINYTTRSNMSISLPAMVNPLKKNSVPQCKENDPEGYNKTITDTGTKYDWNQNVQGLILAAYFYGYLLGSIPSGIIAEWMGPLKTLFIATLIAGIFNSLCVWSAQWHWGALFFMRFIIGVTGGLVYPALQCLIGRWAPPQERGKFVSALMGNTLGTCLSWIIVGAVTREWKWPWGFHVMSIQIIFYLIILVIFTADSPEEHKWIDEEELKFIKESQAGQVSKTKAVPPYKAIFSSFPFWTLTILHFGNLWGLYVQITAVPKFMKEIIGFDIRQSGFLSSLPHLMRLILGIGYGILGDWLKKAKFSRTVVLKSFVLLSHIVPGILMASMSLVGCNAVAGLVLLILSMSINGAAVLTNLSNPTDLAPNFAGTIFSIISFIGGMTGFIVPSITATFINVFGENTKAWSYNFTLGGIVYCGCGIFFIIFGTSQIQPWNEKKEDGPTTSN
ncbi:hypothetical protein GWI33_008927 [Rhynchophorus ferrugineus]|uniref:Major facilitator superfamily (MFS) profile domain-containing protein n=1 Tax=Rhynchophorus ferrugineus TaxID=354439 RepID=A0A834MJZ1_RHYFE|nr:hypothetical protein GWI33_008927 [Rhynchophorus ferrugineus]